jgi:predicted phosphoribosyltransferase
MIFKDRVDAGRRLAQALISYKGQMWLYTRSREEASFLERR